MTAKHPIETEELMAYLDGELAFERASGVVSHLERCEACRDLSAEFRSVSQWLMTWEREVVDAQIPSSIEAALEEKTRKSEAGTIDVPLPRRTRIRRWAWAGALAVLCLLIGLGLRVDRTYRSIGQPMSDVRSIGASAPIKMERRARPESSLSAGTSTDANPFPQSVGDADKREKLEVSAQLQAPPPVKFAATGPMVVHTAGITITVKDFDKARANIDDILRRHHGYIADLNLNTPSGSSRNFTSTLRVPSNELDATIAELRNFGHVESESQNGEEVTEQYVDLQARLSNAHNTEQRLTDLLRQRTGKLSDVLAVETELDRVRGEIEQMEAERKNLANKVDFATINATVTEDYRAQLEVVPTSTLGQIRNAAVEGYRTMSEGVLAVVLFFFSYGPSILLWGAILFFPARIAWKKRHSIFRG